MSRDCIWQKTTQEGVVEARRPAKYISVLSVHSVRSSDLNISSFCELPAFAQSIDANTRSLMLKEMMNLFAACKSLLCLIFCFYPRLTVAQVPSCLWDSKAFREPGYIPCISLGCIPSLVVFTHGFSLHSPGWPVLKILSFPGSGITGVWPLA